MFSTLFSPIQITKNLVLKNRIIMSPMGTNYATVDGYVTERNIRYYQARALGGVGLIIIEAAHLDPSQRHRPHGICISDDHFISGLANLTQAIHEIPGVAVFQQLTHPGRVASAKVTGTLPVGPSALPHPVTGEQVHSLSIDEIVKIETMFMDAAIRVKKAGFDGVEIHGGHGYLIQEFFSPYTNKRTDQYGGDLTGRIRFPLEIVNKIRQAVGPDYPISFRMSATEFIPEGYGLDDAIILARELEKAGVDLLNVTAGTNEQPSTMAKVIPFGSATPGCFAHLAAAIKKVVKIPVITVGRINSPAVAEKILQEGQGDLVALGRALIADPCWPLKTRTGQVGDINKCIACNEGCIERLNRHESISCTVNPWVGCEEVKSVRSQVNHETQKYIMVIGGGPGGMKAAAELAQKGHEVILFEKEEALGGQVRFGSKPPGKEGMLDLVKSLEFQLKKLNVKIKLNKKVTEQDIRKVNPDIVILATGSKPVVPKINGISYPYVFTADDVLNESFKVKEKSKCVVLGGGLVGLETASFLASKGHKITVVEIADSLGANCSPMVLTTLRSQLESQGVTILLNTQVTSIHKDHSIDILCKANNESQNMKNIDYVIVAAGRKSYLPVTQLLENNDSKFFLIGDCQAPRKIINAIAEGANMAVKL